MNPKTDASQSLTIKKKINAPAKKVFSYFTDPALLAKWHAPNLKMPPAIAIDLKVGGQYRFAMHDMEGNIHVVIGVYKEIVAGKKLVFTWRWENGPHPDTTVTVLFKDMGNATEIELIQEGFIDDSVKTHHHQGWIALLGNLETLLA